MKSIWKKVVTIIGALAVITTLVSTSFILDARFAKTEEVDLLSMRLDNKIIQDRIYALQERIWTLEDRYQDREMPTEIKKEILHLKMEIEELKTKIKKNGG